MRKPAPLLLVGSLLLLFGCKSTPAPEPTGTPEAAAAGEETGTEADTPEAEAEPGKLFVEAVADFLKYEVLDAEGKVVEKGDTNISKLELPAGEYSVVVHPGDFPEVKLGPVTVKVGDTAQPKLTGFGTVMIKASEDFMKFEIIDGADTVIATGDTNISTVLLPVGDYTVRAGEKTAELTIAEFDKLDFESGF